MECGYKIVKYRYNPFIFEISQVDINELAPLKYFRENQNTA